MSTSTDNEIDRLFRGNNRSLAASVIEIIEDLEDYWPLTVRQVYYQCVAKLLISNDHKKYKAMSVMAATLRRHDLVTWDAIEDRTRRTTDKRGVSDLQAFIKEQSEIFWTGVITIDVGCRSRLSTSKWPPRKMRSLQSLKTWPGLTVCA